MILGGESEPDGGLCDNIILVGEQVLFAILGRSGSGLLNVGYERLAGLEGLLGIDGNRGIGRSSDSGCGRHVHEELDRMML